MMNNANTKRRVICYHTKTPVFYNKGTKYEKQCSDFLAYYTFGTMEDAKAEAEKLNSEKPIKNRIGEVIDWDKIDYFYADEQGEMY